MASCWIWNYMVMFCRDALCVHACTVYSTCCYCTLRVNVPTIPRIAQSGEVYAIVERANRDVAIESLLNTFEEVWLSKHFELRLHQRMRDTGGQEVSHTRKHTHLVSYMCIQVHYCIFYLVWRALHCCSKL